MELATYGELAVRLVNTGDPSRPEEDALTDLRGLLALIGPDGTWSAVPAVSDLPALRTLRAHLRAVFESAAAGAQDRAVAQLNTLLDGSVVRPQISGHEGLGWHLHVVDQPAGLAQAYRAAAVMGLTIQLIEVGVDRLGVCQASNCRNVFIDTSTNRSRRYCSDRCATRANVAAYRARRRAAV